MAFCQRNIGIPSQLIKRRMESSVDQLASFGILWGAWLGVSSRVQDKLASDDDHLDRPGEVIQDLESIEHPIGSACKTWTPSQVKGCC